MALKAGSTQLPMLPRLPSLTSNLGAESKIVKRNASSCRAAYRRGSGKFFRSFKRRSGAMLHGFKVRNIS